MFKSQIIYRIYDFENSLKSVIRSAFNNDFKKYL